MNPRACRRRRPCRSATPRSSFRLSGRAPSCVASRLRLPLTALPLEMSSGFSMVRSRVNKRHEGGKEGDRRAARDGEHVHDLQGRSHRPWEFREKDEEAMKGGGGGGRSVGMSHLRRCRAGESRWSAGTRRPLCSQATTPLSGRGHARGPPSDGDLWILPKGLELMELMEL